MPGVLEIDWSEVIAHLTKLAVAFALTLPIKAWLAQWVILLTLGLIVEVVLRKLFQNRELIEVFKRLLPVP